MTSPRSAFARRLFGFSALPLLSALSPFLVLPVVARHAGVAGWAAIGVGQSVGALGGVLVIAGWSMHGPARVAAAGSTVRAAVYLESLVGRVAIYLVAMLPIALVVALLVPPEAIVLGVLTAAAFALGGLSPGWYAIGVGRPGLLARFEVLPRAVGALVAAVAVQVTGLVFLYPIIIIGVTLGGIAAFSHRHGATFALAGLRPALVALWRDRHSALAVVAGGLYSTLPVAIVGAFLSAHELARFSSADRLYRIALLAVVALSGALQGWVSEESAKRVTARMRRSLASHGVLGVAGGIGLATLSASVSALLFGRLLAADAGVAVFYGISFAAVAVNTCTGAHMLIPLGRARTVLTSTVAGAIFGVAAMIWLPQLAGGPGGAAGLALGEVVVCLVQAAGLLRLQGQRAPVATALPVSVSG